MPTGFWWGILRKNTALRRLRLRWRDNIKVDLQEIRLGSGRLILSRLE